MNERIRTVIKDVREEWYNAKSKVALTRVEVSSAAKALQNGHLMEDESAHFLAEGLAVAALLGAEMSEKDETVIVQMKCTGSLGGYLVECTAEGSLRGYTEKKTGVDKFLGNRQYQVTRSVPGRIISQGVAASIDGYFRDSLQRRVIVNIEGARGVMIEALPDSEVTAEELVALLSQFRNDSFASLTPSLREGSDQPSLPKTGQPSLLLNFELKKSTPLKFGCRCSPERAITILREIKAKEDSGAGEGEVLPDSIDITCHMCGRTFTVNKSML